jgi:hypothetical protein
VATRLEAIHKKIDANQTRVKPETEDQNKMAANLREVKEDIKTN